jgi:hypothetical protein
MVALFRFLPRLDDRLIGPGLEAAGISGPPVPPSEGHAFGAAGDPGTSRPDHGRPDHEEVRS